MLNKGKRGFPIEHNFIDYTKIVDKEILLLYTIKVSKRYTKYRVHGADRCEV